MQIFRRLVIFLCLASVCFAQHTPRPCADVPIRTTDGKTIHPAQFHGKEIAYVMFRTDCDHCLDTLNFFARMQNQYGSKGLQVIGVSLDDSPAAVVPFAQRYRFPFPIGHLTKEPAIKLTDLNENAHPVVPYLMFVDWQGKVRFQYPGNAPIFNDAEKNLRTIVEGLAREAVEKKQPTYQTRPLGK